jgi:hypothetical protein
MTTATKAKKTGASANKIACDAYYQIPPSLKPEVTVLRHGDRISVPDYDLGYYEAGSVAGYALENLEDAEVALARAKKNGHKKVWINALASIIDNSGMTGEQKAMQGAPAGAKHHTLGLGAHVWMEGRAYKVYPDHNHNLKLNPVTIYLIPAAKPGGHVGYTVSEK